MSFLLDMVFAVFLAATVAILYPEGGSKDLKIWLYAVAPVAWLVAASGFFFRLPKVGERVLRASTSGPTTDESDQKLVDKCAKKLQAMGIVFFGACVHFVAESRFAPCLFWSLLIFSGLAVYFMPVLVERAFLHRRHVFVTVVFVIVVVVIVVVVIVVVFIGVPIPNEATTVLFDPDLFCMTAIVLFSRLCRFVVNTILEEHRHQSAEFVSCTLRDCTLFRSTITWWLVAVVLLRAAVVVCVRGSWNPLEIFAGTATSPTAHVFALVTAAVVIRCHHREKPTTTLETFESCLHFAGAVSLAAVAMYMAVHADGVYGALALLKFVYMLPYLIAFRSRYTSHVVGLYRSLRVAHGDDDFIHEVWKRRFQQEWKMMLHCIELYMVTP